jgi:hypothetical protein
MKPGAWPRPLASCAPLASSTMPTARPAPASSCSSSSCGLRRGHRTRHGSAPPPLLLLAMAALLALSCSGPQPASAQQPMPLQGQGDKPPAVPTDVYVTAYVDRLLQVDDTAYTFQVRACGRAGATCCALCCARFAAGLMRAAVSRSFDWVFWRVFGARVGFAARAPGCVAAPWCGTRVRVCWCGRALAVVATCSTACAGGGQRCVGGSQRQQLASAWQRSTPLAPPWQQPPPRRAPPISSISGAAGGQGRHTTARATLAPGVTFSAAAAAAWRCLLQGQQ